MRVVVIGGVGDLARDLERIPATFTRKAITATVKTARRGNTLAKGFARDTAGAHGVHYPRAFTVEKSGPGISWEYGPDDAHLQGEMSFEWGSRNQPAHLDLNRSADIIGPAYAKAIRDVLDEVFW